MFLSRPELIKKEIFDIAEYVPGKSIEEIASAYGLDPASIIKLGSNENPLGPSSKAIQALMDIAPLRKYLSLSRCGWNSGKLFQSTQAFQFQTS